MTVNPISSTVYDVQISGTFRSVREDAINANFVATNAYLAANSPLTPPAGDCEPGAVVGSAPQMPYTQSLLTAAPVPDQAAQRADIDLDFDRAAAIDLAGRDVLDAVRTSVYPKVIDCPDPEKSPKTTLSAVARNGPRSALST